MEEVKKSRKSAKTNITNIVRKLKTSLMYGAEPEKIAREASLLEDIFDELCSLHMEYEELADIKDDEYLNDTTEKYDNVMKDYYKSLKEDKRIECIKQAKPLVDAINRTVKKIILNLERLESVIAETEFDIFAYEVDKESLEKDLQSLIKYVNELSLLVDASEKKDLIDILSTRADKIKRTIEIMIRKGRSSQSSKEVMQSQESQVIQSSHLNASSLDSCSFIHVISSKEEAVRKMGPVIKTEVSMSSLTNTISYSESLPISPVMLTVPTSKDISQLSDTLSKASITQNTLVINNQPDLTSYSHPSLGLHYSAPRISCSICTSHYLPHKAPSLPYSSNITDIPKKETSVNSLSNMQQARSIRMQPHSQSQHLLYSSRMSAPIPKDNTLLHNTPISAYVNNTAYDLKQDSSINSLGDLQPTGSLQSPSYSQNLQHYSPVTPQFHTNQHQVRKVELPCFSGERREWPEFKAMFRHLAESTYTTQQALAYELKRHIKAPANALIQSIYSIKEGAYEKMWKRLGDVYDDPGASISAALSALNALQRPGEDFRSIVVFINEVESVYAQLEQMNQTYCVSVRDVDNINNLLPMNLKMGWNRLYNKLSMQERVQPFNTYMNFLEGERAAMIRVSRPSADLKRPRRTLATYGQRERGKFCFLHRSAGHKTCECRNFAKLAIKDRYDLLRNEKACFKCFDNHQKGECLEEDCRTCGKPHNTSLCTRSHTLLLARQQHHLFSQSHLLQERRTVNSDMKRHANTYSVRLSVADNTINGENMGTAVNPRCGSCRCGKCPLLHRSKIHFHKEDWAKTCALNPSRGSNSDLLSITNDILSTSTPGCIGIT